MMPFASCSYRRRSHSIGTRGAHLNLVVIAPTSVRLRA
jgi:hypothetical protein